MQGVQTFSYGPRFILKTVKRSNLKIGEQLNSAGVLHVNTTR